MSEENLVVVSKVKKYIKAQAGMNTSACAIEALTKKIAEECKKAIGNAQADKRKTVKGRDVI